ncbi:MAG: hypothetical protein KAT65_16995 [Methanophagales archaeon]|nr:hypothetical protein [Methanophagales archaeon]
MRTKMIAGILVLALVATAFTVVSAQTNIGDSAPMGLGRRFGGAWGMSQLTDEEREDIQQQLPEYRQDLLEQYGITLTDEEQEAIREQLQEKRDEMQQEMQELFEQHGIDLTDDEREEIHQQMQAFRQELFEEYDISCPDGPHGAGAWGHDQRGWMGRGMQGFRRGSGLGWVTPTPNLEE